MSVWLHGPQGPLTVQVARSLTAFDRESEQLLWAFLLAGPLTVVATLAGRYALAGRTLAPVERIAATARNISGERLDRRGWSPTSAMNSVGSLLPSSGV